VKFSSNVSISARSSWQCLKCVPFPFNPSSNSCGSLERERRTSWSVDLNFSDSESAQDNPKPLEAPVIKQSVEEAVAVVEAVVGIV